MATKVFNEEIFRELSPKIDNEQRRPVDVLEFFALAANLLLTIFTDDQGEQPKELRREMRAYLGRIYKAAIFSAKKFKETLILKDSTEAQEGESLLASTPLEFSVNEVHAKDSLWLCIIRGNSDDDEVRSQIFKLDTGAQDTSGNVITRDVIICTFRLFQAIISLLCARFEVRPLPPAPLCANIFRSCKNPKCHEDSWSIHGHSGMNFVANFIKNYTEKKADPNDVKEKKRMLSKLPSLLQLMAVAFRLDEANVKKFSSSKKGKVVPKATLSALITTCQLYGSLDILLPKVPFNEFPEPIGSARNDAAEKAFKTLRAFSVNPSNSKVSGKNKRKDEDEESEVSSIGDD